MRELLGSAVAEHVELVAVEIAEIAGIEAVTALSAQADRSFVDATEFERLLVDALDLVAGVDRDADHHAVADRGRTAIVGLEDAQHRLVHGGRPAVTAAAELHQARDADLREQGVVERRGAGQIVGAKGNVADRRTLLDVEINVSTAEYCQGGPKAAI